MWITCFLLRKVFKKSWVTHFLLTQVMDYPPIIGVIFMVFIIMFMFREEMVAFME